MCTGVHITHTAFAFPRSAALRAVRLVPPDPNLYAACNSPTPPSVSPGNVERADGAVKIAGLQPPKTRARARRAGPELETDVAMFDTERFIAEIESRPAIYDLGSDEYGDRVAKSVAWTQVCEIMIPKWRSLSDTEKNTQEKILRGKWRNIRDYFMKELKFQKIRKNGASGRKRKKYMYFDRLLFLMPNVEIKKKKRLVNNDIRCKSEEIDDDNGPMLEEFEMPLTHENPSEDEELDEETEYKYPRSLCEATMPTNVEEFPDVLSTNSSSQRAKPLDDDDYDRMFLLSLLPIMRRVPEDRKLDVRIQMQQVLAQTINNSTVSSSVH